jgi:hypothetical protein
MEKINLIPYFLIYIHFVYMKILYGTIDYSIDVTEICLQKLTNKNIISIPSNDGVRTEFFTDPLPGFEKQIFVRDDMILMHIFDENVAIKIDILNNTVNTLPYDFIYDTLYPITFSIPEEKIIKIIPFKKKILSNLIPGYSSTYIYNTEKDYYNEYSESYFAITTQKFGWDCMRHYEILANGCIPYFINIENCPVNTLFLYPKQLSHEANLVYHKFLKKTIHEINEEDIGEYNILLSKLLDYLRNQLTTFKMAKYVLEKTNFENASNILYLSGDTSPDYLRCLTLHGFKELFGTKCHDYSMISHIYKSGINFNNLYGKGMTYSNLLDLSLHDHELDSKIEEKIKNKYFDVIIYGSYHRGMPFYDLVNTIYNANEIILLCGEDLHKCNNKKYLERGHYVFVREL